MLVNHKSLTLNKGEVHKLWRGRWNQILSAAVGVVGFFIIFSLVLYLTLTEHNSDIDHKIGTPLKKCNYQSEVECKIKCENIEIEDNVSQLVEAEIIDSSCEKIDRLILEFSSIEGRTLSPGWLQFSTLKIDHLQIRGNLQSIAPYAFTGKIFEDVQALTLNSFRIESWDSEIFQGLPVLSELSLWQCDIKTIVSDALSPISGTLKALQIHYMAQKWDPVNVTGSSSLGRISIVDLRFNSFSVDLNSKSFQGIKSVEALYLDSSNINKIEPGTFANLENMRRLNLINNNLKTLERNVLGQKLKADFNMFLDNNNWHCDCKLQWLKLFQFNKTIPDDPICKTPDHAANKNFSEVAFCGDVAPETTTLTPETSLLPDENIIKLICKVLPSGGRQKRSPTSSYSIQDVEYVVNEIPKPTVEFSIEDERDGAIYIGINSEIQSGDLLIWFNKNCLLLDVINKTNSIGCFTGLRKKFLVDNLEIGETYSFCVVQQGEKKISPLNCKAHVVQKPWAMQTWLSNKEKPLIISTIVLGLIFCLLLGAFLLFLWIRRNPTLLRGSKRVVIVKRNLKEAIVLPPNYKEPPDKQETKRPNVRLSERRGNFRRSVSETSIASSRSVDPSYISATEPTTIQLLNWRLERLRNRMGGEKIYEGPPLPERPKCSVSPMDFDSISIISEI